MLTSLIYVHAVMGMPAIPEERSAVAQSAGVQEVGASLGTALSQVKFVRGLINVTNAL